MSNFATGTQIGAILFESFTGRFCHANEINNVCVAKTRAKIGLDRWGVVIINRIICRFTESSKVNGAFFCVYIFDVA